MPFEGDGLRRQSRQQRRRGCNREHDRELTDSTIETLVGHVEDLPGDFTVVYLEAEGGAVGRVARDATAFPHRDTAYALHIFPGWTRADDDGAMMEWARTVHRDMSGQATGGAYVNLLGGDEPDGPRRHMDRTTIGSSN